MFWFVGNEIGSFELHLRKSSDLVFRQKTRCLKLHNTENMFWLVSTKIGFFEPYIAKSSVFPFCFLKHVALTQRSVCRKVVLFPWLLHGKKVFFQFAASHPAVLLILLKTTFFLVMGNMSDNGFASFWLGYVVFSIMFVRRVSIAFFFF